MDNEIDFSWVKNFQSVIFWKISLPQFKFSFVSSGVEKIRGYPPEEVLEQSLEEILTPSS